MLTNSDIPRVIPCLLIDDHRLVKTVRFRRPTYVGDPVNAIRIFNDKEVDEILVLDINAARTRKRPDFDYVHELASECFMPMAYGGGVSSVEDADRLFSLGVEKVALNTLAAEDPELVRQFVDKFGSQSVVASIDVKRRLLSGYSVRSRGGQSRVRTSLADHVRRLGRAGVGEVLINSIDRDGTMMGYDLPLIRTVTERVDVPVVACGGASTLEDFCAALNQGGASAVAAGSFFVFTGPHRAVLITYPERDKLLEVFNRADDDHREFT